MSFHAAPTSGDNTSTSANQNTGTDANIEGDAGGEVETGDEADDVGDEGVDVTDGETTEGGDDDGEDQGDGEETATTDDSAEVDYEGKKYKVPAALKEAFLRNADYTQKTQALAADRKALAERETAGRANIQAIAQVVSLNSQIAQFENVDWAALEQEDPGRATALFRQLTTMKETRANLVGQINEAEQKRALSEKRDRAKQAEEGWNVMSRDVPGWGAELANKLTDFAVKNFGFSADEINDVVDPRVLKVLHLAFSNSQTAKKQATVKQIEKAQAVTPAPTVKSVAKTTIRDPAKMNPVQYRAWRSKQAE